MTIIRASRVKNGKPVGVYEKIDPKTGKRTREINASNVRTKAVNSSSRPSLRQRIASATQRVIDSPVGCGGCKSARKKVLTPVVRILGGTPKP